MHESDIKQLDTIITEIYGLYSDTLDELAGELEGAQIDTQELLTSALGFVEDGDYRSAKDAALTASRIDTLRGYYVQYVDLHKCLASFLGILDTLMSASPTYIPEAQPLLPGFGKNGE